MTLHKAIDLLLNSFNLEDFIYEVRERAREKSSNDGYYGSSWDLPEVKEFSEVCKTLEEWHKQSKDESRQE